MKSLTVVKVADGQRSPEPLGEPRHPAQNVCHHVAKHAQRHGPRRLITMDLCKFCEELVASLCRDLHRRSNLMHKDYFVPLRGLLERSRHCRLCHLIDEYVAREFGTRSFYNNTQLKIVPVRSHPDDLESPLTEITLVARPSGPRFGIAVWASQGKFLVDCPNFTASSFSDPDQVALPPPQASSAVIHHCSAITAQRPLPSSEPGSKRAARPTRTANELLMEQ